MEKPQENTNQEQQESQHILDVAQELSEEEEREVNSKLDAYSLAKAIGTGLALGGFGAVTVSTLISTWMNPEGITDLNLDILRSIATGSTSLVIMGGLMRFIGGRVVNNIHEKYIINEEN